MGNVQVTATGVATTIDPDRVGCPARSSREN